MSKNVAHMLSCLVLLSLFALIRANETELECYSCARGQETLPYNTVVDNITPTGHTDCEVPMVLTCSDYGYGNWSCFSFQNSVAHVRGCIRSDKTVTMKDNCEDLNKESGTTCRVCQESKCNATSNIKYFLPLVLLSFFVLIFIEF